MVSCSDIPVELLHVVPQKTIRSYTMHFSALCCCALLLPLGAITPQIRSTVLGLTLAPGTIGEVLRAKLRYDMI